MPLTQTTQAQHVSSWAFDAVQTPQSAVSFQFSYYHILFHHYFFLLIFLTFFTAGYVIIHLNNALIHLLYLSQVATHLAWEQMLQAHHNIDGYFSFISKWKEARLRDIYQDIKIQDGVYKHRE